MPLNSAYGRSNRISKMMVASKAQVGKSTSPIDVHSNRDLNSLRQSVQNSTQNINMNTYVSEQQQRDQAEVKREAQKIQQLNNTISQVQLPNEIIQQQP